MKIKYQFITGDSVEIEVPDSIGKVAAVNDAEIRKSNRRETDKHKSLEELAEKGIQLFDESADIHSICEKREIQRHLHEALRTLLPQQRDLIQKVFFEGRTMADIAREDGVSINAIQNRLTKIREKIKKLIIAS